MKMRIHTYNNRKFYKSYLIERGSEFIKITNECQLAARFLSVLLINALLLPIIFLGQAPKTAAAAQTASVRTQLPAPLALPPEPFVLSSSGSPSNSLINKAVLAVVPFNDYLSSGYQSAADSISSFKSLVAPLLFVSTNNSSSAVKAETSEEVNSDESELVESTVEPNVPASPVLHAQGSVKFDFDGDGKADLARWQSSSSQWKIKNSSGGTITTQPLGSPGSIIAPADYDGDGKTDMAVFTPATPTGTWTIKKSSNGTTETITGFGQPGDNPVSGDFDGDGLADAAVYRPSDGNWYVRKSTTNAVAPAIQFGSPGDIPVAGNYDGDSKMDYAVFRPAALPQWHILFSATGYNYGAFQWGLGGDTPVPADYDGDGKTDLAVYRGSSGTWYVNKSSNNIEQQEIWGNYGDQPVPADYDGDGKADFSVWRPTTGVWHTIKSSVQPPNPAYSYQTLGIAGDLPAESAYLKQIGGQVSGSTLAKPRLSPKNATGGTDLYSRNFGWGTGLVGLPGRAGLDMGFGMSYNSLVWIKASSTMVFDPDASNISPGFRFGFPTIEPTHYDRETQKFAYLMVTPSGARVEFKQVAASSVYETADSSYTQLSVKFPRGRTAIEDPTLTIKGTDGTQMTYTWKGGAYRCNQIKDANGNFITIDHDENGVLRTVTDTLGRVITVNYDNQLYPTSVTQNWKDNNGTGATVTHPYATFSYGNIPINTNFGSLSVYGPMNGTVLKVLDRVTRADGGYTTFDYNSYGQVKQINNYAADNHKLNHVAVNLPADASTAQTDCPRFTETRSWAEKFNLVNGIAQEVVIKNTFTEGVSFTLPDNSQQMGTRIEIKSPDGNGDADKLISKTFVGSSGWIESLPIVTEDWADENNQGLQRKRWSWTNWTQDDTSKTYITNPRTIETKVGDATNVKRTTVDYYPISQGSPVALYGLVKEVKVYDADQTTVLKTAKSEYNLAQVYLDKRIIGLPAQRELYEGTTNLMSKVTYLYDEGDFTGTEQNITPVQQDNVGYGAAFVIGRGNLTSTTRHDATGQTPPVTQSVKYNTAGAVVSQTTPGSAAGTTREIKLSYIDVFNDTPSNRNTFAYPTRITDPAGNYSEVKYRYDFGANVWAKSPAPANNTTGKETTRVFDSIGRLEKQTLGNNGAYTRYEYPSIQNFSKVFTTAVDTNGNNVGDAADEIKAETYFDGAGNVIKSRTENPKTVGSNNWIGSKAEYNVLGQVKQQTVPTEIDGNWNPTGDDSVWRWTSQEYDWKGRVTKEIGLDNIERNYSYDGCGCAGGQVTTAQGEQLAEGRRTQKAYADILGRTYKTEILDWSGNVYTTTVNTFNGRDQIVNARQYEGTGGSTNYQEKTATYDGHGRLKTSHSPQQDAATTYTYNADDRPQSVTDARGAVSTYTYNNRGLVERVEHSMPTAQPAMSFEPCSTEAKNCLTDGEQPGTSSPIGYLDNADSTGRVIIGWSLDKDAPSVSNQVHIYIDGPAGSPNAFGFPIVADKPRPDVNTVTGYPGNHGYEFQVPEQFADGKPHTVYAYGIDVSGGNQPALLTNSPKSMLLAPTTKVTTFEYDDLGNRTKMTDETGVSTYEYDSLSRIKAENKHLRDDWIIPQHDFGIQYDYDLSGQLKNVTDPFGQRIDYGMDKAGRLKEISGTPFDSTDVSGTTPVTDYVNNIEYRAWGGVKSIDYGNTMKMSQTFDSRLRVGEFNVWKDGQSVSNIKKAYQYYDDNRLKFSDDTGDTLMRVDSHRFDRSYKYDFTGRLTEARTGIEARGGAAADRNEVPYKQDYAYNAFGNVTSRQTFAWAEADNQTNSWTNNKESSWAYDADGRLKHTPENNYDYDAAGSVVAVALEGVRVSYQQADGEAKAVRRDMYRIGAGNGFHTFEKTEYQIYSTVLGKPLTEVKSTGTKKRTFVYGMGGEVVATQNTTGTTAQHVAWEHTDPSRASYAATLHSGQMLYSGENGQAELDPLGSNVGLQAPQTEQIGSGGGGWGHGTWGDPFGGYSCRMDGFEMPCSQVMYALSIGIAEPIRFSNGKEAHEQPIFLGHWMSDGREKGGRDYFVLSPGLQQRFSGTNLEISSDCKKALDQAGKTQQGLERAIAALGTINGIVNDINIARLLAAIGIQETDFISKNQNGGGPGRGIFQIEPKAYGITEDDANNPESAVNAIANKWSQQWSDILSALGNAGYDVEKSVTQYWALAGLARVHNRWRPGVVISSKGKSSLGSLLNKAINTGDRTVLDNSKNKYDKNIKETANGTYVRNVMDLFFECLGG